jgi:hypothetical protein
MKIHRWFALAGAALLLLAPLSLEAQSRLPSPRGQAHTQVGGSYNAEGVYSGGEWVTVDYGRPILRGRDNMFGSGSSYGDGLLLGAPLWRVGANQTTQFHTGVPLRFGSSVLPIGDYTLFAELEEDEWTLIFSTWGVKDSFTERNPDALWGAYSYTPDRDVLRTTMEVQTATHSADELIIAFVNMTQQGGELMIWWDDQVATTPFRVAR